MAMRLITIPISHYCERARWALDYCGLDYVEEQHLQLMHRRAIKKAGGKRTTPVLTGPMGLLPDSRDIVEYADANSTNGRRLYPEDLAARAEVEELERGLEDEFGVETRRLAYHYFLQVGSMFHKYNGGHAPRWQKAFLRVSFPFAKNRVLRYLEVNEATVKTATELVRGHLDRVAALISDGREFLVGDQFTAADLTFAALSAPIAAPREYGMPLPTIEELPPHIGSVYGEYREHPAVQFALRIYSQRRR